MEGRWVNDHSQKGQGTREGEKKRKTRKKTGTPNLEINGNQTSSGGC